ncbi:MBL fold metallo-hydrolase [Sulfuracidifex metallicus]|uniref:MBL fold metallo-hydrolase n=1 Tax=Sulfuracidifex metallicus TaxID=47303 RepID=UPI0022736C85|nr:MBL fold metallo-hydrolase [Sulfuracidifex metallicus]MCY0849756.1 MBL fold metallo-hydrolase [Sulfuracidifex metallicus]
MKTLKIGKADVIPGSPNTLLYDGIVVDLGGKNSELPIQGEIQLATHGHADHIAGLFREAKSKFLPPEDRWGISLLGRRMAVYGFSCYESSLFTYDLIKEDLQATFKDPEVQVISTPGHTPGHVSYVIGDVLYAGDAFFGQRVLEGFVFPFYVDFWKAMESLAKIKEISNSVEGIVISHGPLYDKRKMLDLIEFNINYGQKLVDRVRDSLSDWVTSQQVVVKVMEGMGKKVEEISPTSIIMNERTALSIINGLNVDIITTIDGVKFRLHH